MIPTVFSVVLARLYACLPFGMFAVYAESEKSFGFQGHKIESHSLNEVDAYFSTYSSKLVLA